MESALLYRLHDDLSFCHVEGHVVFLDVEKDQYFQLPKARERALIAYIEGGAFEEADLRKLIELNILTAQPPLPSCMLPTDMQCPTRSALEETHPKRKVTIGVVLDVLSAVYSTYLQMRRYGLKSVLESLVAYRSTSTSQALTPAVKPSLEQLKGVAATFRRLRLWVPIDTCCLLDSVALIKFLAKRGLHANIVFGVTGDPFSAHCWVQVGELVLNDALGNVNAYTPIRTV